jgi:hypothetical protein
MAKFSTDSFVIAEEFLSRLEDLRVLIKKGGGAVIIQSTDKPGACVENFSDGVVRDEWRARFDALTEDPT